jgi:hypothetical protein
MRFLASRFSHRVRLSCKSQGVWSRQNGRHDIRHRWASNAPTNSREGFGSFHSKDIEVLIRQDAADYVVPHEAAQLQEATRGVVSDITDKLRCHLNDYASRDYSHAAAIKKSLFCINPEFTFINHGAFGAALTPIMGEAEAWRRLCETQPLAFFDRILLPCVANSIRSMSSHLECPPEELMPLPNVTSGLNSVIFSTPLQEGDEVVCFSLTYGSTKKILDAACQNAGANLRIVPIPLPIGIPEDIIYRLGRVLSPRTKLVVLDHITSNTALRLPTLQMAEICKAQAPEVTVVVDAAHALFTEDVKIYRPKDKEGNSNSKSDTYNEDIDYEASISEVVDVWLSNGHKWLCSPKGCAFMWVSPSMKGRLKPAIISHGFLPSFSFPGVSSSSSITYADKEKLLSSYAWDGCRDYAALLTVPSLMETWKSLTFKENVDGYVLALCIFILVMNVSLYIQLFMYTRM